MKEAYREQVLEAHAKYGVAEVTNQRMEISRRMNAATVAISEARDRLLGVGISTDKITEILRSLEQEKTDLFG